MDSETMQPIVGVAVYSDAGNNIFSDFDGKALLDSFDNDELVIFKHLSYKTRSIEKQLIENVVLLSMNAQSLDQIIISASRFAQDIKEIPQRILQINKQGITISNPQTSADLLNISGHIYIQKSQMGGGSPIIRGVSTNRLVLSVDGVRLNNAIYRAGNIHNVISIDPFSIENTEIIMGSSSVMYGSDAIGGAMNFYTKKPKFSETQTPLILINSTLRSASTNNEKTGHFDINIGFKKWALLTSFSRNDFDDLTMGKHGLSDYLRPEYVDIVNGLDSIIQNSNPRVQKYTQYSQFNFMQKVLFRPNNNITADLGIHYSSTSDIPRYDRLIRYNNQNDLYYSEWYYGPQEWLLINSQISIDTQNSKLFDRAKFTTAYQEFNESRNSRKTYDIIKSIRDEKVNIFSINLDFIKSISNNSSISYGVEYLNNKINSKSRLLNVDELIIYENASRYPDNSTWQSTATYLNYKHRLKENIIFQSGLRYSHISIKADLSENNQFFDLPFSNADVSTGALVGGVGISWIQNENYRWKFNLNTAFRAPNLDDVAKIFDSEPGSVVVPNPDLRPERSLGVDLGGSITFDKINFDFSTYFTYLYNSLIRADFELEDGITQIMYDGELSNVQAIQNGSRSSIYGIEIGLTAQLTTKLKAVAQYNFIDGKQKDDYTISMPIRHVPPQFASLHLVYTSKKIVIDGFINYNSKIPFYKLAQSEIDKPYLYAIDSNGNPYSPAWYTVNLRSNYIISDNISIVASIENLTNKLYRPYSSGISAPGINFIFAINYSM
ncbi:MAG: TonB-dependent receptor [Bacteroidota bacterium]|nr:TonB-dependent receptor [Bacteroidota bacterium]